MANPYFNRFLDGERDSSNLIEQLNSDFIYDNGIGIQFLPRTAVLDDCVMNEQIVSLFSESISIDVFVERDNSQYIGPNVMFDFGGFSYGNDDVKIYFDRRKVFALIGQLPIEGDLIYVKEFDKLYEIIDVDTRDIHLSGGRQYSLQATIRIYAPSEGTHHFDDSIKELSEGLFQQIDGGTQPQIILEKSISMDSTLVTVDNDVRLDPLRVNDPSNRFYLADNSWTSGSSISYTADNDTITIDNSFILSDDMLNEQVSQEQIELANSVQDIFNPQSSNTDIIETRDDLINTDKASNPFEFF